MPSPTYPPRDLRPTVRQSRGGTMGPNARRARANRAASPKEVGALRTRIALLTYALSRLPPRQLPLLAVYASSIVYAADKGWISSGPTGKAAASIVGVLSMVTGLLLSHRFSSAVSKWEEGKKVWVAVRTNIRDAIRLISIPTHIKPSQAVPSSPQSSSPPSLLSVSSSGRSSEMSSPHRRSDPVDILSSAGMGRSPPKYGEQRQSPSKGGATGGKEKDVVGERVDELAGLFVGFAFALQHHLHNTRALPQPPLCDLLPPAYLASLKRTEARVRFAEDHSPSTKIRELDDSALALDDDSASDVFRPGLRRRGTGPPTTEERSTAGEDEWELSSLKEKAEEAVTKLAEAVAGVGGVEDQELRRQLDQLKSFSSTTDDGSAGGGGGLGLSEEDEDRLRSIGATSPSPSSSSPGKETPGGMGVQRIKSNLANPTPPNLPLAILKLLEAYIVGLADVPVEKGGWSEAKRERALGIVKALTDQLGEAERLSSTPPPLPLTLHSYHLLTIYLAAIPPSLLCAVSGPALVFITLLAGWCLLGLEALVGEVGGVFGGSEKHHPLPILTGRILAESLDLCPGLAAAYRARMVGRVGEEDGEVQKLDRRRRGREEWVPSFT